MQYRIMQEDHKDEGGRHQNWVFTLNNFTAEDEHNAYELAYLSECGAIGAERGSEGTPHLQGVVRFGTVKTWSQVCAMLPRAYVAVKAKHSKFHEWWNYCFKGDQSHEEWDLEKTGGPSFGLGADVYTWGECPADKDEKKENANDRASRNMPLCMKRNYQDMDAHIVALQLRNYQYGARALRVAEMDPLLVSLPGVRGQHHEWHYGKPGCGKSYYVRNSHDPTMAVYIHEACDKWWDDYDYEPVVVFDDVDESAVKHIQRYKQLLDQTVFRVQIKGGMIRVRPIRVCITSNLHPRDIWSGPHLAAILDRVQVFHWEHCRYHTSNITGKLILDINKDRCPNRTWQPPAGLTRRCSDIEREQDGIQEAEDDQEACLQEEELRAQREAYWDQENDQTGDCPECGGQACADGCLAAEFLLPSPGGSVRHTEHDSDVSPDR